MRNQDQEKQLSRTWQLMADAVERALKAEEVPAATLVAAHRWLSENGINLDALKRWRWNGLPPDFKAILPQFNDDEDAIADGASAQDDPLRVVPPFAATDTDN